MIRTRRQQAIEDPEVNLTPLVDVVFVVLIMFIVIAPLLELDRVELAEAPESGTISAQESGPITIHVRQDNTILFNNKTVGIATLRDLFIRAKQQHPTARPQLFHDKKAHFGTYQAVKNAAEAAGFEQIDIILKPS